MKLSDMKQAVKKTLSVKVKKLTDLLGCHVIGVRIDSGNRKDLKCVVCRLSSVVCGLCQLIPMYVHYYVNTVQYYFTR